MHCLRFLFGVALVVQATLSHPCESQCNRNNICEATETCGGCPSDCCPGNDECRGALTIFEYRSPYSGSTQGALVSRGSGCFDSSPDVWFKFTAENDGVLELSSCGTEWNHAWTVVESRCGGNVIACERSSDFCDSERPGFAVLLSGRKTYLLKLSGITPNNYGSFSFGMGFSRKITNIPDRFCSTRADCELQDSHIRSCTNTYCLRHRCIWGFNIDSCESPGTTCDGWCTISTFGRVTCECPVLGIPCVQGTDDNVCEDHESCTNDFCSCTDTRCGCVNRPFANPSVCTKPNGCTGLCTAAGTCGPLPDNNPNFPCNH